jgi:hypothetical protein
MIEFLKNYDSIGPQITELVEGERIVTFSKEISSSFYAEEVCAVSLPWPHVYWN